MSRMLSLNTQDFATLRDKNMIYVDKTMYIDKMRKMGRQFFLARPRRFGKSLFASTLRYYFQGRKDLFEGLAISETEKDWTEHPVLHFAFINADYTLEGAVDNSIHGILSNFEMVWGKSSGEITFGLRFEGIIRRAYEKTGKKVVIIIDEYDNPLVEVIDKPELKEKAKYTLKGFFGALKNMDEFIEFSFLTGITKFSKTSIFSGLNHLTDISMFNSFSAICGITEMELHDNYNDVIEEFGKKQNLTLEETYSALKKFYDG
ncbi:MAG: AAA family ATPase, partial [Bacteroidales bacterium]|nr:AAA family ATPase [Bacteroidales bacterium]